MHECKQSLSAHFVTLTYDTAHVPITKNRFMGLSKRDLQLFFKRLRKRQPGVRLKYYAAGEYGGKTNRPHYHVILFNASLAHISPAWEMGEVHYGEVTPASVGYTLKYISKQSRIPMHRNDDRQPEFALMSKGLGESYITYEMMHWHLRAPADRMYCNLTDGKKIAMPRYYKQKIYSDSQRKAAGVATRIRMLETEKLLLQEHGENLSEYRAAGHMQQFRKQNLDSKQRDKL